MLSSRNTLALEVGPAGEAVSGVACATLDLNDFLPAVDVADGQNLTVNCELVPCYTQLHAQRACWC